MHQSARRSAQPLGVKMSAHRTVLVIAISLAALLSIGRTNAAENEAFARGLAGVHPILWKDFEPLYMDSMKCFQDQKDNTGTCQEVTDKVIQAAYDALVHAWMINAFDKQAGPHFCTDYPGRLIEAREVSKGASYAILLFDQRLKYGSSLYGSQLPDTYLAKIVYDGLVHEHPCGAK
jgi:hypothetical protein